MFRPWRSDLRTSSYYKNVSVLHLKIANITGLRYQLHVSNYLKLEQNMVKIYTTFILISVWLLSPSQIPVVTPLRDKIAACHKGYGKHINRLSGQNTMFLEDKAISGQPTYFNYACLINTCKLVYYIVQGCQKTSSYS